jgi:hypothetical protein
MKKLQLAVLAAGTLAALVLPAGAARRKSDKGPHPLKILKVVQDVGNQSSMGSSTGRYHVWMQNTTDVAVDKVQVELELFSESGRLVETVKKDIGEVGAGAKSMVELKYNVIGERTVKPRFWVLYNAGKEAPVQFEIDGPSWNF